MKWEEKQLDELGFVGRGKSRHRPRDAAHLYDGSYPFVQTGDVKHASLYITNYSQTYSEAGLAQSKLWPKGTLCITIAANIAETAILGIDACFPDSVIGFLADKSRCDVRFVKYKFDTIKQRYQQVSHGAAQDNLSLEKLLSFKLDVPPVQVQQRIGDTLAAYDSLIENNLRRMTLLEESARLLYREWFVRLRFPGYEHARIVNGVPEGWETKKMQEVCESVGGGTPSTTKSEFWEGGDIIWVTPTDITRNNCLALLGSEKKITEAGLKNSSAKLLPPETILMTSRATLGFFGLADREVCTNQGFISIIPHEDYLRMYLLHNLIDRREEIIGKAGGTTYKEINKSTFRAMDIIIPSRPLLEQFHQFAYDTLKQTRILKKQTEKTKAARDLLLPRLMSGEIAV